jgi:hypothetical protein
VAETAAGWGHLPEGVTDWRELARSARETEGKRPSRIWPYREERIDPEILRRLDERDSVRFPTLRGISAEIRETDYGFVNLMGDFLDAFYVRKPCTQAKMIAEPPEPMPERWQVPFLAASACLLAYRFDLDAPPWTGESRCYLPEGESYYPHHPSERAKERIREGNPLEFTVRNLFFSWNVLYRV